MLTSYSRKDCLCLPMEMSHRCFFIDVCDNVEKSCISVLYYDILMIEMLFSFYIVLNIRNIYSLICHMKRMDDEGLGY